MKCLACNRTFTRKAAYSNHAAAHARKGELIAEVVGKAGLSSRKTYTFRLPENITFMTKARKKVTMSNPYNLIR